MPSSESYNIDNV